MIRKIFRIFIVLFVIFCFLQTSSADLHFGIISAVKKKVKELKEKVEKEKAKENSVVLRSNTKVLSAGAVQQLIRQEGGIYYFSKQATEIGNLALGDMIISTQGEGFLRKITAINSTANEWIVTTTSSTLEEAFERINIIQTLKKLTPNDINTQKTPWLRKGVSLYSTAAADEFYFKLENVVLYDNDGNLDTKTDQIVANGSITFTLNIDFKLELNWLDLRELKLVETVQETTNIEIKSGVSLAVAKEVEIGKYYFGAWIIGPVVFTPELSLVVGTNATTGIAVSSGITQQGNFSAGVHYIGGEWKPTGEYKSDFQFNQPSISMEGEIKGYAGPKLAFKIYGVVGPYVNVDGYLKLNVNSSGSSLFWTLYGGLEGIAGVEMAIFSIVKVGYNATVIDYKKVIGSGTLTINKVTGRILWNEQPLQGRRVFLSTTSDLYNESNKVSGTEVQSASDGTFIITTLGLPEGTYWLHYKTDAADFWLGGARSLSSLSENVGDIYMSKIMTLLSPANNATGVSRTPTLQWQAFPDATTYDLTVYNNSTGQLVLSEHNITGISYTITNTLSAVTKHEWFVITYNSQGHQIAYYSSWYFTTGN